MKNIENVIERYGITQKVISSTCSVLILVFVLMQFLQREIALLWLGLTLIVYVVESLYQHWYINKLTEGYKKDRQEKQDKEQM